MPGPVLPASFGRYTLLELVGGGGMASVYRAGFSGAGGFEKELAVKVVRPELATDPQFVELFLDEARLSARLSHANLVHTFDFGQVNGVWFLAMEYVLGPTLAKLLRMSLARGLPLGVARSIHLAGEVARGLGFAHRLCDETGAGLGLVHRDVSPQNVLISREGEVKLADFGIAKAASRSAITRTGHIRGKCAYMAPEQAQGDPLDARADVFALGVVLWECLTGQPLFDGASDGAVLLQVLQREIAPPSRFGAAIPATLDDLVLRMLARDRTRRPANGDEVARELAELKLRLVRSTDEIDLAAYQRALGSGTAVLEPVGQGARSSGVPSVVVELDSAAILASGSHADFDPLAVTRLPAMVAEGGGPADETRLSRPATGSGERIAAEPGSPGSGEVTAAAIGKPGSGEVTAAALVGTDAAEGAAPRRSMRPKLMRVGGMVAAALLLPAGLWWTTTGEAGRDVTTTAAEPATGDESPGLAGGADGSGLDPGIDHPGSDAVDPEGGALDLEGDADDSDGLAADFDGTVGESDGDRGADQPGGAAAVADAGSDPDAASLEQVAGAAESGDQQNPPAVQPHVARGTGDRAQTTGGRVAERARRPSPVQRRQAPAAAKPVETKPGGEGAASQLGLLVLTSTWEGIVAASLDGREIAKMGPKSPRQFEVPAGRHEISFQSDQSGLRCRLHAEVKPGEKTSLALQAQGVLEMAHGEFIPRRCLED